MVPPVDANLKIVLTSIGDTLADLDVFVIADDGSGNCDPANCLEQGYVSANPEIIPSVPVTGGATYFVVVDGYQGAVGDFELQVFDAGQNWIFATSTTHLGSAIGGLTGADAICQAAAADADPPLAGNFVAWLSTNTVNAIDRLDDSSGWMRPDLMPFARSQQDLLAGHILYPPRVDELDNDLSGYSEWAFTGTEPDGTVTDAFSNCNGWTGSSDLARLGAVSGGTAAWTTVGSQACGLPARIICMNNDHISYVPFEPEDGRMAWLSEGTFTPGGGFSPADSMCQAEGADAGYEGAFMALLAMTTNPAASYFSTVGGPWIRPDGVTVIPVPADFIDGAPIQAPINVTTDGTYVGNAQVWTGADSADALATNATNCSNFSNTDEGAGGVSGNSSLSNGRYFNDPLYPSTCDTARRVYCLQL
jgi:hypothetical protein